MKQIRFITILLLSCLMIPQISLAQDESIAIVEDGVIVEDQAEVVGEPWEEVDGFLEQQGTNQYLWANPIVGPGDFHVTVEMTINELFNEEGRGSAASFAINDLMNTEGANGSNFGFAGGSGQLFAEGNFFWTSLIDMGPTPIQEGQAITLEFIREGDTYRFLLDGEEMLSLPRVEEDAEPVFRSGYYRVGLRPWRSRMQVKNFIIEEGAATFGPIEEKITFVEDGMAQNIAEVGFPWEEVDGALENYEEGNYLFGDHPIFGTDFRVYARLSMEDIEGSAATFTINADNNFGFSGGSGTVFIDGSFFANAPSISTVLPIEEETFFDFEFLSDNNKVHILINNQEYLSLDQPGDFVGFVGFRPWRSFMRISDFYVEPLQGDVAVPPEAVRSLPDDVGPFYTEGATIEDVKITVTVPDGLTSNATIIDTIPENWTAEGFEAENGTASFQNGTVNWQLSDAEGTVVLNYDLIIPTGSVAHRVTFDGQVDTSGVDGLVSGFTEMYLKASANSEIYIVEEGQPTEFALELGEPWSQLDNALERTGTGNFLLGDIAIVNVNYEITADLTLFGLGGTAVSINIRSVPGDAQSNFGFEGGGGEIFLEGSFFDESTSLGPAIIEDGVPFTFKMVHEGDTISFLMDDEEIFNKDYVPDQAFRIGLRPWRSRMQVSNFVIRTFDETSISNWSIY